MLIREEPATELTVATRILARAGALPDGGRATVRAGEVVYVAARGVSNHTMTPYDVAIVRVDGDVLFGEPPSDVERYLERYRADRRVGAVVATADALLAGVSLAACAMRALGAAEATDDVVETAWRGVVAEAKASGTLIGAFPDGAGG